MVQTMGAYVNKKEMSSEHSICINHRLNWNWPFVQDMHLITMMQHMHCTLHSAHRYRCPQNKWHIAKAIGMSSTVQQFKSELKFWILIEFFLPQWSIKVEFIVQKLNLNCRSTHHWPFLNWVNPERADLFLVQSTDLLTELVFVHFFSLPNQISRSLLFKPSTIQYIVICIA